MSRLFITPREIDFISDLTKEVIKDVNGQKIYYFKIREDISDVHNVYEESMTKIFNPPIEIECLVDWEPNEVRTNRFGSEEYATITTFIHARDILDKGIDIREGDYFSYDTVFYEITTAIVEKQAFGQVEHNIGYKLIGKQARTGQIDVRPHGPFDERYSDDDAIQSKFVQQRGNSNNELGETADKRSLIEQGKLEAVTPKKVEKDGTSSSFYGDTE